MPVFPGRVEARLVVPAGVTVEASTGAQASAVTLAIPAGAAYPSELVATLKARLDENVQAYPLSASAMSTAVGYGTWTTGWMMNEQSGSLAAAFGSPSLAPTGTPLYGIAGPRGGIDKAIGFDTNTELFSGGDVHDPVSGDLLFAMVVKLTTSANGDFFGKGWGTNGYLCTVESGALKLYLFDGTNTTAATCPIPALDTWCVVMGVLERATNRARIAFRALDGSSSSTGAEVNTAAFGALDSALNFTVGHSNGYAAHLGAQIAALYIGTGSGAAGGLSANLAAAASNLASAIFSAWTCSMSSTGLVTLAHTFWPASVSFTSTALRDALGFEADIVSQLSATGTRSAAGVWIPDSPLNCDQHPSQAPEETDARQSESPTGNVLALAGNRKYVHENVRWARCPVERIREASATVPGSSFETFFRDAISGLGGHPWLGPSSPMQIYWNNAGTLTTLGADSAISGWKLVGVSKFADCVKMSQEGFAGQFDVTFPRLVSNG